eukprot:gene33313-42680_t
MPEIYHAGVAVEPGSSVASRHGGGGVHTIAKLAASCIAGCRRTRWRPTNGDEGMVVHAWVPGHHDPIRRSCFADALLYVELFNGRAVVIAAQGVQALQ